VPVRLPRGRYAVSATIATPRPGRRGLHHATTLSTIGDCSCTARADTTVDPPFTPLYAATVPGTRSPDYAFAVSRLAEEPELELAVGGTDPYPALVGGLGRSPPTRSGRNLSRNL
jgi:hypothetical protein